MQIEQRFARHTAVVLFIPADGVEYKLAVIGAAIFKWLAGNDIVGRVGHELRRQRGERFRELSIGQAVSFQGAGQRGLVGGSLRGGGFSGNISKGWQQ